MSDVDNQLQRISQIKPRLEEVGIAFDVGLSIDEIETIEETMDFTFPPDLKLFLQQGIPVSQTDEVASKTVVREDFPKWRSNSADLIDKSIEWVWEGIEFDMDWWYKRNVWHQDWGEKPATLDELKTVMKAKYMSAPLLIPIYSHRFLPAEPCDVGNPVYSVMQTDIICYGKNLADYLEVEFLGKSLEESFGSYDEIRKIDFWHEMLAVGSE